jgi:hypothetical protein
MADDKTTDKPAEKHEKVVEKVEPPKKVDKPGEDFCQVCGGTRMKYIGGVDYDTEDYMCLDCEAIHTMRVFYKGGVRTHSAFESIL